MSVKLPLNQPVELLLTRPDPKAFNSPGKPPCIMYSVALIAEDGREDKLFLPPSMERSIDELQLQAREPFTIVKRKTPGANSTEYFELATNGKWTNSRQPSTESPAPAPKPVQSASSSNQMPVSIGESSMRSALLAAVDLARDARDYGATRGLSLEFNAEDIRCLAATLFINSTNSAQTSRQAHAGAAAA